MSDRWVGGALRPLVVPAFRRLALSYSLNELAWGFGTVALALLAFDRTGSAAAPTALFLATSFTPALVGPALTARLDRYPVRRVLPLLYAIEAALFVALTVLVGAFWLPAVLALALADGAIASTARALSRAAVVAALRPAGLLERGNRLLNVCFAFAFAAGPGLGGLVVATLGIAASLAITAGLFATMAAVVTSRTLPPAHADPVRAWGERFRAGLAYVRGHSTVRRVIGAHALAMASGAAMLPIEVVYARRTLGGAATYGVIVAAWGAGTLLSSLGLARVRRSLPALALIPAAAAVIGAGQLVMAVAPSVGVAVAGCLVAGAGNGLYSVSVVQAVQERVPDAFQARVMGLVDGATAASLGVGYVAGAVLTALLAPRGAIAASAVAVLAAAGAIAFALRGDRRAAALPAADAA